ncbi:MAG: hypothetical protein DRP56_08970 [Planctomycetota bacterium]|nr:MAG: hypothetical protein DRP56_08970 [Planctomycetota bacterium]
MTQWLWLFRLWIYEKEASYNIRKLEKHLQYGVKNNWGYLPEHKILQKQTKQLRAVRSQLRRTLYDYGWRKNEE